MRSASTVPDGMPVLSRGKHRSARRGACFMEMASVLAGERWSDHPSCTHPLLAQLARQVNDNTSDADRQHLVRLIPSVVGRQGPPLPVEVDEPGVDDSPGVGQGLGDGRAGHDADVVLGGWPTEDDDDRRQRLGHAGHGQPSQSPTNSIS